MLCTMGPRRLSYCIYYLDRLDWCAVGYNREVRILVFYFFFFGQRQNFTGIPKRQLFRGVVKLQNSNLGYYKTYKHSAHLVLQYVLWVYFVFDQGHTICALSTFQRLHPKADGHSAALFFINFTLFTTQSSSKLTKLVATSSMNVDEMASNV